MPLQTVTAARTSASADGSTAHGRVVRSRAPLRLGLAGGGSDVSPYCDEFGGAVLNATIDRYCYTTLAGRSDDLVRLCSADMKAVDFLSRAGCSLPLHAAVYRRLCHSFDLGRPALNVTSVAEAPAGSGLGSSSALVVSLVEAFREYFHLPLSEYEVARLSYEIEREDCGLTGGRQDQYAATFGGFNLMEFGASGTVVINPLRLKPAILHELEASIVLFQSGVSRASAGIIEAQAAHIRLRRQAHLDATHAVKSEALAMKEALLKGNLPQVAMVLNRGWKAKKGLAEGVSTSEIERIFSVAMSAGALAGKVSGAGGGGYLILVCEPTNRPTLLGALAELPTGAVEPVHFVPDGAVAWTLR